MTSDWIFEATRLFEETAKARTRRDRNDDVRMDLYVMVVEWSLVWSDWTWFFFVLSSLLKLFFFSTEERGEWRVIQFFEDFGFFDTALSSGKFSDFFEHDV